MMDAVPLADGVVLRPATVDDAAALTATLVRNRAYLAPFDVDRPESFWTLEGQRTRLESLARLHRDGTVVACVLARADTVIGYASLNTITYGPVCSANLGYWVDATEAGHGLAGAAVGALARIADADLGLHRIEAGTSPANVASQRVLVKNGFQQYGTARGHLFLRGAWQDSFLFERILNDRPPR